MDTGCNQSVHAWHTCIGVKIAEVHKLEGEASFMYFTYGYMWGLVLKYTNSKEKLHGHAIHIMHVVMINLKYCLEPKQ